jgi:hypothetical protein
MKTQTAALYSELTEMDLDLVVGGDGKPAAPAQTQPTQQPAPPPPKPPKTSTTTTITIKTEGTVSSDGTRSGTISAEWSWSRTTK